MTHLTAEQRAARFLGGNFLRDRLTVADHTTYVDEATGQVIVYTRGDIVHFKKQTGACAIGTITEIGERALHFNGEEFTVLLIENSCGVHSRTPCEVELVTTLH